MRIIVSSSRFQATEAGEDESRHSVVVKERNGIPRSKRRNERSKQGGDMRRFCHQTGKAKSHLNSSMHSFFYLSTSGRAALRRRQIIDSFSVLS